jgi:glycosyltransferase involved in cell wall biosynthesis
MRVMHVITGLSTGGAETMLLKLLSAASGSMEHVVVSLGDEGTIGPRISALGVPVHCLGLRRNAPNPFRALSILPLARRIAPQLIQGWMYHGNLMGSLAAFALRKSTLPESALRNMPRQKPPVLWNIRQTVYDLGRERWLTAKLIRLGARLSSSTAAIIYNSQTSAGQHEELGYRAEKRVIIPNGFDCQVLRPDEAARKAVRAELGIADDTVLVGLIARYHPMKDHIGFIKAAALVVQSHPQTRFVLAGTGISSKQPELAEAIQQNKLGDRVILLGERSDIPRLNNAFDIGCSASAWGEGFSNSTGEAMACGVPCAVTDVGDSAYIVADSGFVAPPRAPEALASAIGRLVEIGRSGRQQLGAKARQRIETEFSLSSIVQNYETLYLTICKSNVCLNT